MSRRLVKVAKELNVGTATIVDYLLNNGFEVENKPSLVISDEMYENLLKEFKNSIAIKEQAEKLVIGHRPSVESKPHLQDDDIPVFRSSPAKEKPTTQPAPTPTAPPIHSKEDVKEKPELSEDQKPKIKVVGKIDLNQKKKILPEQPSSSPEQPEEQEIQQTATPEPEVEKAEEEVYRAETPQLKGLKILGKIDTVRFNKPKSRKKEDEPLPKPTAVTPTSAPKGPSQSAPGAEGDAKKKRKRKRKKVEAENVSDEVAFARSQNKRKKEETSKVSSRDVDDKVKSTLSKINVGFKSKRQKVRRESREVRREKQEIQDLEKTNAKLQVTEFISVSDLASVMDVAVADVIMTCMNLGVIVSINQRLDAEIIELIAEEFGFKVEFISVEEHADVDDEGEDEVGELVPRAPIVTVMGHVDHGKTSLLDYIRKANVVAGEAGGITQHIGAYEVEVREEKRKITFLDTPGHEAFTAMRARGAKITDIAVIIVAADDNVMPQTKEAISHAQAAGVPLIFAINKIDKPGAAPEKIKQELAAMNLLVEDWGGKYQSQDISAKAGTNIDLLLEKILLEADILDLKATPSRSGIGTVIEASLDKGRGYVTKLLVQNGSVEIGDMMVAGENFGKIKAMFNERGKKIKSAGPSTPVLVLGLNGAPQAGEKFKIFASDQEAKQIANKRAQITREQNTRASKRISLDEIGRRLALGTFKELNVIVKGDVDGSIEALSDSLIKLSVETIQVNIIHKAVGQITESDVLLASASDALIIGFQVRPSASARKLAEKEGVEIKTYSIIYEAIEEIKLAMEGMLEPKEEETITGQVDVREVFKISKVGTVAGCLVTEGKITRNANIRIIRDGIVVYPTKEGAVGEISALKRFKDDVKEVKNGMECGISIKNFNDIKVGDIIEVFEVSKVKQTLG